MKKLKRRFIWIASLSVLLVMLLVLGLVNMIGYIQVRNDLLTTITVIAENDGVLPGFHKEDRFDRIYTEESRNEVRYFSVVVGDSMKYHMESISTIETGDADKLVKMAKEKSEDSGDLYYNDVCYMYQRTTDSSGDKLYVFIDVTSKMTQVRTNIKLSSFVGLICMILLFTIFFALSKKAISPMLRNIEQQKQFITNAGHELKTPVAIISANTEVLEMIHGKNEWTESIMNQSKRLSQLVNDLIALARMQEGSELVLEKVNASSLASDVVASFKTMVEQEEKEFSFELEENLFVMADQKNLPELYNILLDNANKYCDEKGKVSFSLKQAGKYVKIMVSNSYQDGEGVDYSRFFDRFYREDQSHNSKKRGFGIGLSMASEIVKMYKGKITVSYQNGMISFLVTLPKVSN